MDLLVVTSTVRGRFKKALSPMGGVSSQLVLEAPCPVLVLPTQASSKCPALQLLTGLSDMLYPSTLSIQELLLLLGLQVHGLLVTSHIIAKTGMLCMLCPALLCCCCCSLTDCCKSLSHASGFR